MANVSKEVLDRQPAAILGRAIRKAQDNGWNANLKFKVFEPRGYDGLGVQWRWGDDSSMYELHNNIIFNHDFARALWGEGGGGLMQGGTGKLGWDDHLKLMVIAPDPIAYLGEHI